MAVAAPAGPTGVLHRWAAAETPRKIALRIPRGLAFANAVSDHPGAMHAADLLKHSLSDVPPVTVVHGDEQALKRLAFQALERGVLGEGADEDVNRVRLRAADSDWARVRDELATVSMFGGRRLVVLEEADEFISEHRGQLEGYCEKPARRAVLVLDVKSWKSNTRLAKRVAEMGLELDCSELAGARLQGWLVDFCQQMFGKQLTRDAAALLVELIGAALGSLEQEIDKLATAIGERTRITVDDVRQYVGGWKTETTWAMLNAVRDDDPAEALACLQTLLVAGEAGPKLLGGVGFVFRKLAEATELSRLGRPLPAALREAGVFPRDLDAAERYLRRIRRPRAEQILARLVKADSDLKGGSPLSERLQLELLLLWLTGRTPLAP